MLRLCLILTTLLIGLTALPAYADEAPVPTAQSFQVSLPLVTNGNSGTSPTSTASVEETLVALINLQRAQAGCTPLAINPLLTQAAQAQAQDMADHNFIGHTGTDGSDVGVRVDRTGYSWMMIAENLSVGRPTADATLVAWMGSSTHRANILDCSLHETGIGFVHLPNDTGATAWSFYWTQVFATR